MAEQEEQCFDNFDTTSYTTNFDSSYTTEASDDACEETTSTNDPENKLLMTPPAKRHSSRTIKLSC